MVDDVCRAQEFEGFMACERCGLEWLATAAAPGCEPITYDRMRAAALLAALDAERSYDKVKLLALSGAPASIPEARKRWSDLKALTRLLDLIIESDAVREALKKANKEKR